MANLENELLLHMENAVSNTLNTRKGAFERLNELLDNPLAKDVISRKTSISFDPQILLDHVLKGLQKQTEKYARADKADKWLGVFNSCVQKILVIVGKNPFLIDSSYIVSRFISALEDENFLTFCGTQFIQILSTYLTDNDLTLNRVKLDQWNDLLTILMEVYVERNSIPKDIVLQGVSRIIHEGIRNSYIVIHLTPCVSKFEEIFLTATDDLIRKESLSINYAICEALAVQNTALVAKTSRKLLPKIIENYYVTRHDDYREITFKFFHLFLVLESLPESPDAHQEDPGDSLNILKLKMFNILDTEFKQLPKASDTRRRFSVSPFLVKFGASLYVDLIRTKFISQSGRGSDEQASKRARFNEEFYGILEMAKNVNQEIDLGWFCVLCEIIMDHRDLVLSQEDLENVVKFLEEAQGSVKMDILLEYFCRSCKILLPQMKENPKCREAFQTIAQGILKGTIDAYSGDLLRLMINLGIVSLEQRVKIVEDFRGIRETEWEMKILIAAFNDANTKEVFFTRNPLSVISQWMNSSVEVVTKLQPNLVAQMICVFVMNSMEVEVENSGSEKSKINVKDYSQSIDEIKNDLKYKFLCKFIGKSPQRLIKEPRSDQVSLIHFKELMENISQLPAKIPSNVAAFYFSKRSEIFLNIYNTIEKLSLNGVEDFLELIRSEVIKNVMEVEIFVRDKKKYLSRIYITSLIESLHRIFKDAHGLTRSCEVSGIVRYICDNFNLFHPHLQGSNEESYRVILTNCLQTLIYLHEFHADSVERDFKRISEEFLDSDSDVKRRILLDLLRTIIQRPYNESLGDWACREINDLVKRFNRSQKITEDFLDIIRDALIYFKTANPNHFDEILVLITRLLGIAIKNSYRPKTAKILLNHIVELFRNGVADDQETAEAFIEVLNRFLKSPVFTVQLSVVRAIVEIFEDEKNVDFTHYPKNELESFFTASNGDSSEFSLRVQLFHGLFVNCQPARRFILFKFAEMLSKRETEDAILQRLHDVRFNQLAGVLSKYVEHCVPDMVELWSRHAMPIERLPTNISGCSNREDFMEKYRMIFPKFLIYHGQERSLRHLGESGMYDPNELIKKSLPECYPFILSGHNDKCRRLKEFFGKVFGTIDDFTKQNGSLILKKLFENFWDNQEYEKLFGVPHNELMPSELQLNCEQFEMCVNKLSWDFQDSGGNLFNALCHTEPFEIVKIFMSLKEAIFLAPDTYEMLCPILRFIHFSRKLTGVLNSHSQDNTAKNFFFSEVTRFLLNLTTTVSFPATVIEALLNEFYEFLEQNFQNARNGVKQQLEFVVERLTRIIRSSEDEDVKSAALRSLRFLFIVKQDDLSDALKVINNVPKEVEFDTIRRTQDVIVSMNFSSSCDIMTEESVADETGIVRDIEHFLAIRSPNVDSIKHLKGRLAKNPEKMLMIYQQINFQQADTILHRLTNVLIKCTQSEDELSLEATKCLSEMGYLELRPPHPISKEREEGKKPKITYSDQLKLAYEKIILKLQELQQDSDVFVSNVASTTLNAILSDPVGREQDMKNKKIFMSSRRGKQTLNITEDSVNRQPLRYMFSAEDGDSHERWIERVAGRILTAFGCTSLSEIAKKKTSFAEFLVPTLTMILLAIHCKPINGEIQQSVNDFFVKFGEAKASKIPGIHLNKKSIQIMLTICDCIRFYNAVSHADSHNARIFHRIDLDNLVIAEAACYSESFSVAIIFAEIGITKLMNNQEMSPQDVLAMPIREIMIECYEAIEEKDAAKPFYDLEEMRLWYLNNDPSIGRSFVERDMANALKLEQPNQYEQLLQKSSLHYLTKRLSSELNFECAWRMGDWSVLDGESSSNTDFSENFNFERDHYRALKNLKKGDANLTQLFIDKSRLSLVESMKKKNPQSSKIFLNHFTMLRQMQQIEDFTLAFFSDDRNDALKRLCDKWMRHDAMPCTSFVEKEKILAQRLAILDTADTTEMIREKHKTLLKLVHDAREANCDNIAIKYLKHARGLSLDDEMESKMLLEDAQLCKSFGYTDLAKKLFSRLINDPKYETFMTRITGLWTCGEFFSDNNTESPNVIFKDYFLKAKDELNAYQNRSKTGVEKEKIQIFTAVAKFADKIYSERDNYLNSNDYKEKCHYIELTQQEAKKLSTQKSLSAELSKEIRLKQYILLKNCELDKQEIETIKSDRSQYLSVAIEYYLSLETLGESCDVNISRLVSLWCSNPSDKKVTEILTRLLDQVPSYKFLKVLPQLASRLGHSDSTFRRLLEKLIERCCADHPYHTLNHIMALQNANYDAEDCSIDESGQMLQNSAKRIIEKLQKNRKTKNIVKEMQEMNIAFIDLANKNVERSLRQILSPTEKILTMGTKQLYHLPTVDLPVRKDGNYSKITYVNNWFNEYTLLSGINVPKKLLCTCSDGSYRSIIVKGNDDLRQDALMQQVFLYINDIFKAEPHLQKLQIRTYKIIPLTKRSGFMEFCENSTPMSAYLTKAHSRYRPSELPFSECRKVIMDYAQDNPAEKLTKYLKLCKQIKPVFYNYFLEQFPNPREWYERRVAYINTVASTSMLGYVLGIGDRHLSNILLDQKTAEIIHIDFGIAFEKGLIQRTPELVPFRLTRDIVSAMGFLGVDGIFRRSCEVTMEVLRENQAIINTILEVLLYDPLCNWSTSQQMCAPSNESIHVSEQKNASAARALFRVNEKLSGRDSNTTVQSVGTQVERLIQLAINPANLSRMFHGWSAFY